MRLVSSDFAKNVLEVQTFTILYKETDVFN